MANAADGFAAGQHAADGSSAKWYLGLAYPIGHNLTNHLSQFRSITSTLRSITFPLGHSLPFEPVFDLNIKSTVAFYGV